jgi:hypothetical protein
MRWPIRVFQDFLASWCEPNDLWGWISFWLNKLANIKNVLYTNQTLQGSSMVLPAGDEKTWIASDFSPAAFVKNGAPVNKH